MDPLPWSNALCILALIALMGWMFYLFTGRDE